MSAPLRRIRVLIRPRTEFDRSVLLGVYRYANTQPNWDVNNEWTTHPASPPEQDFDGLIVREGSDPILDAPFAHGRCVCVTGHQIAHPRVWVDDREIGRRVAERLTRLGHRCLYFFGDPAIRAFADREAGFRDQAAKAGLKIRSVHPGRYRPDLADSELRAINAEVARVLRTAPKPVAAGCVDAEVGRRVLRICRQEELRVPDDVAVIACEYDELISSSCRPGLSGLRLRGEAVGYEAAALLDRLLDRPGAPPPDAAVLVPPGDLEERGSSVPAPEHEPLILQALDYIRTHATSGISVQSMADSLGIHRRTLEQHFLKDIGHSPLHEIRRVRLSRACEMVRNTRLSLTEIAARCGYSHASHMSGHFREALGYPASALRESPDAEGKQAGRATGKVAPHPAT